MQPSSIIGGTGPVQGVTPVSSLQTQMHSPEEQQQLTGQQTQQQHFPQQYDQAGQQQQHTQQNYDDLFEQMFSMPWDFNANHAAQTNGQKLLTMSLLTQQDTENGENLQYFEDPALLACRLRQHQLNGNVPINVQASQGINEAAAGNSPSRSMMLQLNTANGNSAQLLAAMGSSARGPVGSPPALPLSLGQGKPGDITEPRTRDDMVTNNGRDSNHGGLLPPYACATRGLRPPGPNFQPQVQMQGYGVLSHAAAQHPNPSPPPNALGAPPTRPRVRARRGQATDPHSIAERLRRERIAERMKALQELVPNSNKTDKASMLDEIIDYVKFLQLQVKVLSMSRLGGAGAVAPLVADLPSEGSNGQVKSSGNGNDSTPDGLALTERQVAKLMEEDMGSAMQYLQGKGLCLMPISLATAISSTTRSTQQQSAQHASTLQGLFTAQSAAAAGNGNDRQQQQVEQANSSLSAISSIGSSNEANKSNAVPNMNSNSSNGLRSAATTKEGNGSAIALKADDESHSRR